MEKKLQLREQQKQIRNKIRQQKEEEEKLQQVLYYIERIVIK